MSNDVSPWKRSIEAPGNKPPVFSQVPTSQSQEVEFDLSGNCRISENVALDPRSSQCDEIIPSSQSQEIESMRGGSSPRRLCMMRELKWTSDIALANSLPSLQSQIDLDSLQQPGEEEDKSGDYRVSSR